MLLRPRGSSFHLFPASSAGLRPNPHRVRGFRQKAPTLAQGRGRLTKHPSRRTYARTPARGGRLPRGSWTPTAHILPIRLDEGVRYCAKSAFSLPRASILGHAGKRVLREQCLSRLSGISPMIHVDRKAHSRDSAKAFAGMTLLFLRFWNNR